MTSQIATYMNVCLSIIGYLYIIFKSSEWLTNVICKSWVKRRKDEKKQKAINDLYDAFNLDELTESGTMKVTTRGGLTIMIIRE